MARMALEKENKELQERIDELERELESERAGSDNE